MVEYHALYKVYVAVAVCIPLLDSLFQLRLSGVLSTCAEFAVRYY